MKTIKRNNGNDIKIYATTLGDVAFEQIKELGEFEPYKDSKIRIMPDCHAGAGCTIGTTMEIKDKIVPNLVGVDIGCFTGDTKVPLINGTQRTLKELTELGEPFYVYSVNKDKEITYGEAIAIKTRNNANLVKVVISGGEEIVCTPDHKFMLRNGDYKEAKDLIYLDSLMPLYRTYQTRDGYESIIQPNNKKLPKNTHKLIYQQCFGEIPKDMTIHHKNGNKFDNTPENLQLLTPSEHSILHAQEKERTKRLQSEEFKKNRLKKLNENGFYAEEFTEKKKEIARENILNYMKNNSESFSQVVEENALRGSKFFSNKNSDEVMKLKQKLGKIRKILINIKKEKLEVNFETYDIHRCKFYNYPKYDKFQKILKEYSLTIDEIIENKNLDDKLFNNHKVIIVEALNYTEDVYCLNVKEHHNFALASGIFVHNCGMLTLKLKESEIDLQKLDAVINEFVPNGFNIHSEQKADFDFTQLIVKNMPIERAKLSIGSLGGGNHFIEAGKNSKGELFLVIHSGSRNIGGQVAKHYQDIAIANLTDNSKEREELIERLKKEGKQNEIGEELKKLKKPIINKDFAYLTGTDFDNYMHDMELMQKFAVLNRRTMANIVLDKAGLTEAEAFETIHNYIDFKRMILRKGAVSAENGETLLIPINMRDGSIIAKGKGNEDWNFSAPHGAGRLMGRNEAHKKLNFDEFKEQMKDVYSTSVLTETLDESPNAYKSMNEIIEAIGETVEIIDIIKPIYNFKAH